jgi:hypothetical protein
MGAPARGAGEATAKSRARGALPLSRIGAGPLGQGECHMAVFERLERIDPHCAGAGPRVLGTCNRRGLEGSPFARFEMSGKDR